MAKGQSLDSPPYCGAGTLPAAAAAAAGAGAGAGMAAMGRPDQEPRAGNPAYSSGDRLTQGAMAGHPLTPDLSPRSDAWQPRSGNASESASLTPQLEMFYIHFLRILQTEGAGNLQTFVSGHIPAHSTVSTAHNGSVLRSIQDSVTHVHVCSIRLGAPRMSGLPKLLLTRRGCLTLGMVLCSARVNAGAPHRI